MKLLLTGISLCCVLFAHAQDTFTLHIRSKENALPGATVSWKETQKIFVADSSGNTRITAVPAGVQHFSISHIGFAEKELVYTFPLNKITDTITLDEDEEEEEEVIVTSTRTSRTIANTPTRTEVISGEELAEKGNMKPGDIRMLLSESTGIQTQQTSATSYNSSIRIQGLDGRYTQLLKDGLPLYSGFSGGLSLMQIVPLDLRQVEVIKGSASTIYGGGAIAGLVNLVSKTPGNKKELRFLSNATSAGGLDLSGFYSERFKHTGVTVFASANNTKPYDPAGIGLTAIPSAKRYTINPRFFLYGKQSVMNLGITYITENRTGGSMAYINDGKPGYYERNHTDRVAASGGFDQELSEKSSWHIKASYSSFKRAIDTPQYHFGGLQGSGFGEINYRYKSTRAEWVYGLNIMSDVFSETKTVPLSRDYNNFVYGGFVQNTWNITEQMVLESGLRADHAANYGWEWLPRVSLLYKPSTKFTTRLGGGMGYKIPTVFNEESEKMHYARIAPIDEQTTVNERSAGINADINFNTRIGDVKLSINQLFFYTRLNNPLVLENLATGYYAFKNATGHIDTKGFETNLKLVIDQFKLFTGYTYASVNTHFNTTKSWTPLTPRHRLNNVLMYEKEGSYKLGLEAYYTSRQQLSDGAEGKAFWTAGFMAEKSWQHISLFINFENFTDTRQTKFDTIYTGSIDHPVFRDIYAPVDGFVVNGGIKLQW